MMIKVEIHSAEVKSKSGISAKTGKPYTIREVEGWAHLFDRTGKPNPHPTKISLTLDDDQQPYAAGLYELSPGSFYADRFGQLNCRAVLTTPRGALKSAA